MMFNRSLLCALLLLNGCGKKAPTIIASHAPSQSSTLSRELLEKIYNEYVPQLKNKEIKQNPFMITFSGVSGMGKSFIAQQLATHYNAVRISTDALREIIIQQLPDIDKKAQEEALQEYMFYMLQRYNFPNRRLILDASIDRTYTKIFPYLENNKIPYIVIRLEAPRELIIERIMQREGSLAPNYLKYLDRWLADYDKFGNTYKNYFLFKNVPGVSLDPLLDEIDNRLNANSQEKQ